MSSRATAKSHFDGEHRPLQLETFNALGDSIIRNPLLASSIARNAEIPSRVGEGAGGLRVAHFIAASKTGAIILLTERRDLLDLKTDSGHSVKDEITRVHGQKFIDEFEGTNFKELTRS